MASELAKADLVSHGILPDRIIVVGNPVRLGLRPFAAAEKARLRQRLGLGEDPVLLISSGATGAYRSFDALLRVLRQMNYPMDVVTFKEPAVRVEQIGRVRVWRLGFREDFCDFLSASDLVVGKLGSHTAAEALAAATPIVVYDPIPGQEEENATYLVAKGTAVWPRSEGALAMTISNLLHSEGHLIRERMAQASSCLARPNAASEIVRILSGAMEARA